MALAMACSVRNCGLPPASAGERMGLALALDHAGAGHQRGKARAVERGRHDHHAQILAQHALRFQRQRQAQIGVEMPLVRFVEQHRADPASSGSARIVATKIASVITTTRVRPTVWCRGG
jgi:hypothetical protein